VAVLVIVEVDPAMSRFATAGAPAGGVVERPLDEA
jgi:hypothetical protein